MPDLEAEMWLMSMRGEIGNSFGEVPRQWGSLKVGSLPEVLVARVIYNQSDVSARVCCLDFIERLIFEVSPDLV